MNHRIWVRLLVSICPLAGGVGIGVWWERNRDSASPGDAGAGQTAMAAPASLANPVATPAAVPKMLPLAGEFETPSAILLGCNDLVRFHPEVFADIVTALKDGPPLIAILGSVSEANIARRVIEERSLPVGNLYLNPIAIDSMWVRDFGPVFARQENGAPVILDLEYDRTDRTGEWGQDDEAPRHIARGFNLPVLPVPLTLHGGNLLSNGEGLTVTTTAVFGRNAERGIDKAGIGEMMGRYFGTRRWVFFDPLQGEPTGHADMFVNFLAPNVVLVGRTDPAKDPENARIMDEAAAGLAKQETSLGPMQVHRIAMPPRTEEGKFWRTYTNAVLAGGTVLVPVYSGVDEKMQSEALALYARLLPGWKVAPINVDSLCAKNGFLHCITVNVPGFVAMESLLSRPAGPVSE